MSIWGEQHIKGLLARVAALEDEVRRLKEQSQPAPVENHAQIDKRSREYRAQIGRS